VLEVRNFDIEPTALSKPILPIAKGSRSNVLKDVGINGKWTSTKNIVILEKLANAYAIGRDTHVGDTIIGLKEEFFEAAALIIKAHHLLEKHIGKWQQYWKEQLGNWYGMLFHEGQFLDPV
jgi:argininosuccinate synthase